MKTMGKIISEIKNAKTTKKKVDLIKQYNSVQLRTIFDITYNPDITWRLPDGDLPVEFDDVENGRGDFLLSTVLKSFYIYLNLPNRPKINLKDIEIQSKFLNVMANLDNQERDVVNQMRNKKLEGITAETIRKAIPNLLKDEKE